MIYTYPNCRWSTLKIKAICNKKCLAISSFFSRFLLVYNNKEPITLVNLEPSTQYQVQVQLSRPGEGGEGAAGPVEIMETGCPGKTICNTKL